MEWLKDDEPVKASKRIKIYFDSEVCRLTISDTVADDEGEYKCVATNELGTASCSAELLVNEAIVMPEFKEKMKHTEVFEGDTARFDVQVLGNPKPVTVWSKGGKAINDGGRFKIVQSDDDDVHSLLIENVSMDDFGSYKCVASNEAGRMQCSARLEVKEKQIAPEFSDEYGDSPIEINEGDELKINVTIQGNPRPDVEWYKDDRPLKRTSRVNISARGNKFGITIFTVVPEDSGIYKCVATSAAGTKTKTFQVNIEGKKSYVCLVLTRFSMCSLVNLLSCKSPSLNKDIFAMYRKLGDLREFGSLANMSTVGLRWMNDEEGSGALSFIMLRKPKQSLVVVGN